MADKSVIGGGLGSITDAEIKDLTSQDIEGRGIDYYRKLGELISPDYAKPTVPEVMFNFFAGMTESASKPGATFAGSVGQGGRTAGEYLFQQEMLRKKRERELPLTGLRLKSLTGKGKDTKPMVVVGDFEKNGELVPLGSTYNPTDREITDNPSAFAPSKDSDSAIFNWFLNLPENSQLSPRQAETISLVFARLTKPTYKTLERSDGRSETVVEQTLPETAVQQLLKTNSRFKKFYEPEKSNIKLPQSSNKKIGDVFVYNGTKYKIKGFKEDNTPIWERVK